MDKDLKEWLALYYSPSTWNKRMDPEQVVDHHVNICTGYSEATRKSSHCELSVRYGNKKAKIDIFYPTREYDYTTGSNNEGNGSAAPVLMFVHGGYAGKQEAGRFIALLVNHGQKLVMLPQLWLQPCTGTRSQFGADGG